MGVIYIHANGGTTGSVTRDIGADVRIRHGPKHHGGARNQETRRIPDLGDLGRQKHDIARHDHGRRHGDQKLPAVKVPAHGGEGDGEEGADNVGRHAVQLLLDHGVLGVDGGDNGGHEEGQALDGDVVEKEDDGDLDGDGARDAAPELEGVDAVDDFRLRDALGFDARDAQVLFLPGEPLCRLWAVGQCIKRHETQANGDNPLDGKDHAPIRQAPEILQFQNRRCEQPAKRPRQRRHDDVQRQAKRELGATVPSGHVVRDAGEHARLKDAQQEADAADGSFRLDESRGDADAAKEERGRGEEPTRADVFAGDGGGDLKEDVGDVEDGEDHVVVVALEVEVLVQARDTCVSYESSEEFFFYVNMGQTYVCAVDEAEEIQNGDCRDTMEVHFPS